MAYVTDLEQSYKMDPIEIIERDMTPSEWEHMNAGFDEHAIEHGVMPQDSQRIGFVAVSNGKFIGCVSGLAYKNGEQFNGWCYLTDLFVEKEYRLLGMGAKLLQKFEETLLQHGIHQIWTWTAGYEAPKFYGKQGYEIFAEMENWYSSGDSRLGLRKRLDGFFALNPEQWRAVHFILCEHALEKWNSYANAHSHMEYVESVAGTWQKVDKQLPFDSLASARQGVDFQNIAERYREPIVALQNDDLSFPDDVTFAYYAIYNLFKKYVQKEDIDDWIIVNQALSSENDSDTWNSLLNQAIHRAKP